MVGDGDILAVDIALRGGAGVLLVLVGGLLARDYGRSRAARLGALLAVGAASFAVCSMAGFRPDGSPWRLVLLAVSTGNNVVFWLFARALFDDDVQPRAWHGALWAAFVSASLICGLAPRALAPSLAPLLDDGLALAALVFATLAVVQTVSSWRADLIERRRRLRVAVVGATAAYMGLTAIANLTGLRRAAPEWVSLADAVGLVVIAVGVAWSLLGVAGAEGLFAAPETSQRAAGPIPLDLADQQLLAAVERAMRIDRAYRQDGLTIGALAARHGSSEHRLRRLINQGLGHRNFNAFLSSYRIADARTALADPSQAAVPILTMALDAGFGSLGPFNRAFRLDTGMTPTEYRRQTLGGGQNSPPNSDLASRIRKSA